MTNPTADDIKHELKDVRYATGKGAWDSAEDMTRDVSAELRRRGIPHSPAQYDAGGNCLTCGEGGRCPGVHTFEEIQEAAREKARVIIAAAGPDLFKCVPPVTSYEFPSDETAREAWDILDRLGRQRNGQTTVAHLDGRRVYLRPEYATPKLMRELADLGHCATLEAKGSAT